jgi:hypothetical protein
VDLTTYAELAVRLANTACYHEDGRDRLATMDGLHALVADREHLSSGPRRTDLEALRGLRAEFRAIFADCAAGRTRSTPSCPATRASAGTSTSPRAARWPTSTRPGRPWGWPCA